MKDADSIEADIILSGSSDLASPSFLRKLRDEPHKVVNALTEVVLGAFQADKIDLAKGSIRVLKAMKFGRGVEQFVKEWNSLREKGCIEDDEHVVANPYFETSLLKLLELIDGDIDEEKLKAVRAMFFLMLSKSESERAEILGYQLLQLTISLSSSELLTLRAAYDLIPIIKQEVRESTNANPSLARDAWYKKVADHVGHGMVELVDRDATRLVELKLFPEVVIRGAMHPTHFKPSDLGKRLCEELLSFDKEVDS